MTDTPPRPFPAQKPPVRMAWARIDPEGNVTATWRTWGLIAGAIIWATMLYAKLEGVPAKLDAVTIEVQVHREVLIKAGLLPIGATVNTGK